VQWLVQVQPPEHHEYDAMTDMSTDEAELSQYHLADDSVDKESNYSIGELSLISEIQNVKVYI